MYQLHTEKQIKYFGEVIRLHNDEGMCARKISRIIPIGHTTVSRWIAIFAAEKRLNTAQMKVKKVHPIFRVMRQSCSA